MNACKTRNNNHQWKAYVCVSVSLTMSAAPRSWLISRGQGLSAAMAIIYAPNPVPVTVRTAISTRDLGYSDVVGCIWIIKASTVSASQTLLENRTVAYIFFKSISFLFFLFFWLFIYMPTAFWRPENTIFWKWDLKVQVFENDTVILSVETIKHGFVKMLTSCGSRVQSLGV